MRILSPKSRAGLLLIALSCAGATTRGNAAAAPNATSTTGPVLLMGLPRSGSETIHAFLQCMGIIETAHQYCCDTTTTQHHHRTRFPCADRTCAACLQQNLLHHTAPFRGCSSSSSIHTTATPVVYTAFDEESFSQEHGEQPYSWFLPQHFALPLLHGSTGLWVVNTIGNADTWATHILHWYSLTQRLFHAFAIPYHWDAADSRRTPTTHVSLDASLARARNTTEHQRRHAALVALYEHHTERVVAFAKQYQHPYLLLPVTDADSTTNDSIRQLARALGLSEHRAKDCWKVDPHYGDDWKDVRLPF